MVIELLHYNDSFFCNFVSNVCQCCVMHAMQHIISNNVLLDRLHEILVAKRKIGGSYKLCATPDTPCIAQLALIEEGRDVRCVLDINRQLKLLQSREQSRSFYLNMVKQSIAGYSNKAHYVKPNWIIGSPQLGMLFL